MSKLILIAYAVLFLCQGNTKEAGICDHSLIGPMTNIDSPKCGLIEVPKSTFSEVVGQMLSKAHISTDILMASDNYYHIVYFDYDRQTGFYLLLKITADSMGNFVGYEIKQNMVASVDSSRKRELGTEWIKKMNFQSLYGFRSYTINNCYFSDGADIVVLISRQGEINNGINLIEPVDSGKGVEPYAPFIKNCNKTFYRLYRKA
jgi:hypothetical protein